MLLARVVGNVVATKKDARLEGRKLLILETITPGGDPKGSYVIAVDTVGAGVREEYACAFSERGSRAGRFESVGVPGPGDADGCGLPTAVQLNMR